MRHILPILLCAPGLAFAAGGADEDRSKPPKKTETTQDCFSERQWDPQIDRWVRYSRPVNGVWDEKIKKCIRPDRASSLDPKLQEQAVRELAYAGRYEAATAVLDGLTDQTTDFAQTYRGFLARKQGNIEVAMVFYQNAIDTNPDNILARSYMGQGLVEQGDQVAALRQLREIQARGGAGTWAETALRDAILTGTTYDY